MTLAVVDSSAVVAVLTDAGSAGRWATERLLATDALAAPALMPFEVANILRRHEAAGLIGRDQAVQAHADLLDLDVQLWPHEATARRAWDLRATLTAYDAAYVALGEALVAPLITLDARIARAPGHDCRVLTPSA